MKKLAFLSLLLATILQKSNCQEIPDSALYLGQTPPGNTQTLFPLSVSSGYRAVERMAFSANGKEIYFSELNVDYSYTFSNSRIKYYKYFNDMWNGPFILFDGFFSPAFSVGGDTLFLQKINPKEVWYSVRVDTSWSAPAKFMSNLTLLNNNDFSGNMQQVSNGTYYLTTSLAEEGIGGTDAAKLIITPTDTLIESLGFPPNTIGSNNYLTMAPDESFAITYTLAGGGVNLEGRALISYPKPDGKWTNPKQMGFGGWATTLSPDNKYLFYSSIVGTNYSIYWIRIDNIIDSLKYTNFVPYYTSNSIQNLTDTAGQLFMYTIPDTAFFDDDGNNTLSFAATLYNGNDLPDWLSFDTTTLTFSGIPTAQEFISIKVTATDTAGASCSATFSINIIEGLSVLTPALQNVKIFPNPAKDLLTIQLGKFQGTQTQIELFSSVGEVLYKNIVTSNNSIDLSGIKPGIYYLRLIASNSSITKAIVIE